MGITDRIQDLIQRFSSLEDWQDRYKLIIDNGKELGPMNEDEKVDSNKVKGCQSQVWLSSRFEEGKVYFTGDSDAAIVKGIVALLLEVYSGSTPTEILTTSPQFLEEIGLKQHLSMSRANGLNSMVKQITIYAMAYKAKEQMGNS